MTLEKRYLFLFFWIISFFGFSQTPEETLFRGDAFLYENQYDSAIFIYEKGLAECVNCQDTIKAKYYAQIGKSQSLNFQKELAIQNMLLALNLYEKEENNNGKAKLYIYIAEYWRGLSRFDKANLYLQKFEELNKKKRLSLALQAYYYNRKAAVLNESTDNDSLVIFYSKKVIEIAKKIEDKNLEANSYNELGFLYIHTGQKERGIDYYNKSLNIFKNIGDLQAYSNVLINIIDLYEGEDDFKKAFELSTNGLQLIETRELYRAKREFHMCIHRYFVSIGDYKKALFHYKKHQEYNFVIHSQEFNEKLVKIDKEYDIEKHKTETLIEQDRANFAEKEVRLKNAEKKQLIWYLLAVLGLLLVIIGLFLKIRTTNKKLNVNLQQKEVLLQEVHHRVKNNLTLLNSLLYLRAKASDDATIKTVLNECQSRVQSMALVHQNLYDVDDASKVDFNTFLKQLVTENQSLFNTEGIKINAQIDTHNTSFDMGFTVFLGLIINELLTNSIKYAFDAEKSNSVSISLTSTGNKHKLTYADSGKGLPENFDIHTSTGFGFKLIQIMLRQINGTFEYSKKSNMFTLSFKK